MDGWIKIHRKMIDWEWFTVPEMVQLYVYLIAMAAHCERECYGAVIERGQVLTGRGRIARDTNLSDRTIRTCLKRLKSTGEVTIKTTSRYSIITICNYDKFNSEEDPERPSERPAKRPANDQQVTSKRPANDHIQELKNLRIKELKNKEKKVLFDASLFTLPDGMNSPELQSAWFDWVEYRLEIKKPIKSEKSVNQIFKEWAGKPDALIASIRQSIKNEWQGLFEPKETKNEKTRDRNSVRVGESKLSALLGIERDC